MKTPYSGFRDPLPHAFSNESLITAWPLPVKWFLFAVSYFFLAYLCLETRDSGSLSSTIWLPAGLTLGVLSRSPLSRWPLWIISAGLLHVLVSFLHDRPTDIALIFALNDLMTLSLTAYIWKVFIKHGDNHRRKISMIFFIILVFLASILGGISTIISLNALAYPTVFLHFVIWSISNATGCLAIAPIFVLHNKYQAQEIFNRRPWQLLTLFIAIVTTLLIFIPSAEEIQRFNQIEFALYSLIGIMLLCSFFLNAHQLCFVFIVLAIITSTATLYSHGPFSTQDYSANEFITSSQLYLLIIFTFGLLFHSLVGHLQSFRKISQQQVMLISAGLSQQKIYSFSINMTTQSIIWSKNGNKEDQNPFFSVKTAAQLLGRVHTDDRLILAPWFKGIKTVFLQPHSCPVRLLFTCEPFSLNSNTFTQAHLALINDCDDAASLLLNGVLIVFEDAIVKPIGTTE
ncbi:MASE1 domain-containing protein [Rouxiella sp. T17]|uniref:MASE1 domain-containing protein n=1 Tax=Rouxiella sp. T17 TaxID=3085684 RepID=UPI002FC6C4D2